MYFRIRGLHKLFIAFEGSSRLEWKAQLLVFLIWGSLCISNPKIGCVVLLIFGDCKADVTELFPMWGFHRLGDMVSLLCLCSSSHHPPPLFLLTQCFVTTFKQPAHLYSSCWLFLFSCHISRKYGSWDISEFWLPSLQDIARKHKYMRKNFHT